MRRKNAHRLSAIRLGEILDPERLWVFPRCGSSEDDAVDRELIHVQSANRQLTLKEELSVAFLCDLRRVLDPMGQKAKAKIGELTLIARIQNRNHTVHHLGTISMELIRPSVVTSSTCPM